MSTKRQAERCAVCGKRGVSMRRVSRSYGKGASLLVVEDVPLNTCPHCGESYLTAETAHALERIKLNRHSAAKRRPVPVARFD